MSTVIGLTPSGSSTVHIYTKTIHRTTQNKQYTEQHKNKQYIERHNSQQNNTNKKQQKQQIWKSAGRAQFLRVKQLLIIVAYLAKIKIH
jgi:Tfp pilus assembly protein PilE